LKDRVGRGVPKFPDLVAAQTATEARGPRDLFDEPMMGVFSDRIFFEFKHFIAPDEIR
jgi:hypothetical protein